jgi:hypothetical protein
MTELAKSYREREKIGKKKETFTEKNTDRKTIFRKKEKDG